MHQTIDFAKVIAIADALTAISPYTWEAVPGNNGWYATIQEIIGGLPHLSIGLTAGYDKPSAMFEVPFDELHYEESAPSININHVTRSAESVAKDIQRRLLTDENIAFWNELKDREAATANYKTRHAATVAQVESAIGAQLNFDKGSLPKMPSGYSRVQVSGESISLELQGIDFQTFERVLAALKD